MIDSYGRRSINSETTEKLSVIIADATGPTSTHRHGITLVGKWLYQLEGVNIKGLLPMATAHRR